MRRAFGASAPTEEELALGRAITELERTLAVFEGGRPVATTGIYSYQMTVPGGMLPTAGVTRVAVLSSHRRRGLLTAMMRQQLTDIHERGEPLAALYASEAPIYGRFGYGLATYMADLDIERARARFRTAFQPKGQPSLIDVDRAVESFSQVWDQVRSRQPGMLDKGQSWWRLELADLEKWREGASEHYRVLYERDGRPAGFALYRVKLTWNDADQPDGTLNLEALIASDSEAYAALWQYILSVDLMVRTKAVMRPVEEPLRFLLADSRSPRTIVKDGLWLRLVDVARALAGRSYAGHDELVLEVRDSFCPWNEGRYQLLTDAGRAECRPTRAGSDVVIDAADLAAAYLGGNRFLTLEQAGLLEEVRPGAVARLDALFKTDRAPWCPSHF
jgi:predicted acetyltransferase